MDLFQEQIHGRSVLGTYTMVDLFHEQIHHLWMTGKFYGHHSLGEDDRKIFRQWWGGGDETNDEIPFSYIEASGRGPSKWGELDPKWRACGVGKLQSPIDFVDKNVKVNSGLGELQKNYKPANATIISRGRDIMVAWKGDAGNIIINGISYNLQHSHWHTPSEHSFNGTRYDLELHMVHQNSHGQVAVVGIVYRYGEPDSFLSKLFPYIKSVTKQEKDLGIVNPGEIEFGSRKYYRYNGSLSVPPCTEVVLWTLIYKARTVSPEQVRALKNAVDEGFEMNARPLQPLYAREVYFYNPWDI
ncbi:alpha carbonic anhydrase 4-like [Mercurialis annua]|uniref:alpha carbonic anhydrase 4-like n=1 Tax=Mercurialis annua TaxID=3986 RepID=UPI00215DE33D|nr:alpha carbonic anhydrase 4-like [Mercurialis annua]